MTAAAIRVDLGLYILDDDGEPVACQNTLAWAVWRGANQEATQLAMDFAGDSTNVSISTVFLGIDHNWWDDGPPLLWETMVFGGPFDLTGRRYATRAEALIGHAEVVAQVRAVQTKES